MCLNELQAEIEKLKKDRKQLEPRGARARRRPMNPCSGWLFDLYAHPEKGVVFWLLGEDEKPHCFFDRDFEVTFYAGGAVPRLRELWRFLRKQESEAAVHAARRPVRRAAGRGGSSSPRPRDLLRAVQGGQPAVPGPGLL